MSTDRSKLCLCGNPAVQGMDACSKKHAEDYALFSKPVDLFADDYAWAEFNLIKPKTVQPEMPEQKQTLDAEKLFIEQAKKDARELPCGDSCGS
jgi:hypothetical protein